MTDGWGIEISNV